MGFTWNRELGDFLAGRGIESVCILGPGEETTYFLKLTEVLIDLVILFFLGLIYGSWTLLLTETSEPFVTDLALMISYIFFFSINFSWLLELVFSGSTGLGFSVLLSTIIK